MGIVYSMFLHCSSSWFYRRSSIYPSETLRGDHLNLILCIYVLLLSSRYSSWLCFSSHCWHLASSLYQCSCVEFSTLATFWNCYSCLSFHLSALLIWFPIISYWKNHGIFILFCTFWVVCRPLKWVLVFCLFNMLEHISARFIYWFINLCWADPIGCTKHLSESLKTCSSSRKGILVLNLTLFPAFSVSLFSLIIHLVASVVTKWLLHVSLVLFLLGWNDLGII